MTSISPVWGVVLNLLIGLGGLLESTGATNLLNTSGGRAGVIAATAIAAVNIGLHSLSSAQPGPLSSDQPSQAGAGGRPRT